MNRLLRTAYWTCFVYILLAFLSSLAAGARLPFAAFLCLFFGLILSLLPHAAPKLSGKEVLFAPLGLLVSLLGFLLMPLYGCALIHYIAYTVGLLSAALFIVRLRHRTTHALFSAKFRFSVVAILALMAVMYLFLIFGSAEDFIIPIKKESVSRAVDGLVPIAIILLITGVLLLRGLRGLESTVNERDFNRRQLRDLLIYASLVGAVFMVYPYLYKGFVWLLNDAVYPFFRMIGWAFNKFLELIARKGPISSEAHEPAATLAPTESAPPYPYEVLQHQDISEYMLDETGEDNMYRILLYIFLGIAAAVLLVIVAREAVKLIRSLRERALNPGRGYPNEIRESLDKDANTKNADRPRKHGEPRIRIRYYYREFLRCLGRIYVPIEPSDTCGRINERAQTALTAGDDELNEFRGLYERARYCHKSAPDERDAERMKTLYESLKKTRR